MITLKAAELYGIARIIKPLYGITYRTNTGKQSSPTHVTRNIRNLKSFKKEIERIIPTAGGVNYIELR